MASRFFGNMYTHADESGVANGLEKDSRLRRFRTRGCALVGDEEDDETDDPYGRCPQRIEDAGPLTRSG